MVSLADAGGQIAAEEARLVSQMAAGDAGAPVAELYRRYGRRLYRLGMQLLGDSVQAGELVQDCFVQLWQNAGSFDGSQGSVGGYLFAIARGSITGETSVPPEAGDID